MFGDGYVSGFGSWNFRIAEKEASRANHRIGLDEGVRIGCDSAGDDAGMAHKGV